MRVGVEHVEDCPSWEPVVANVQEAARLLGMSVEVESHLISTVEQARERGFTGSPTIRLDDVDPFARPGDEAALACRLYATPSGPAGLPTVEQIADALRAWSARR
ncbi:MAG: thioredoxin family protein [Actinomycetota bacterium]|nr:thioredoxin family protein [Actinomycetota bacterium]